MADAGGLVANNFARIQRSLRLLQVALSTSEHTLQVRKQDIVLKQGKEQRKRSVIANMSTCRNVSALFLAVLTIIAQAHAARQSLNSVLRIERTSTASRSPTEVQPDDTTVLASSKASIDEAKTHMDRLASDLRDAISANFAKDEDTIRVLLVVAMAKNNDAKDIEEQLSSFFLSNLIGNQKLIEAVMNIAVDNGVVGTVKPALVTVLAKTKLGVDALLDIILGEDRDLQAVKEFYAKLLTIHLVANGSDVVDGILTLAVRNKADGDSIRSALYVAMFKDSRSQ